jgi:hypothetical protein
MAQEAVGEGSLSPGEPRGRSLVTDRAQPQRKNSCDDLRKPSMGLDCRSGIGRGALHSMVDLADVLIEHDEVPDGLYACLDNGWTSNNIGIRWSEEIFRPETTPRVPGHSENPA